MSGLNNYQKFLIEFSFKNLKNKPNTSNLTSWYEESGSLKHRVDLSSVWVDADYIPYEAPVDLIDDIYSVNGLNIVKLYRHIDLTRILGTKASFYNELLIDSIDPSFGNGYDIVLTDAKGQEIPFGLNKWVVDSESGVLTFIDGFPDGYDKSINITFYRYVGRKGNNALLKTDGSTTMDNTYVPTENKGIATKEYVDQYNTELKEIVDKLIPSHPDTFENKDLILLNNTRKGFLVTSTDSEADVIYEDIDEYIKVRLPMSWDQDKKGYLKIVVNNNSIHTVSLEDIFNNNYNKDIISNISIEESYPNELIADGFYNNFALDISLNIKYQIRPFIIDPLKPLVTLSVMWFNDEENYSSNPIYIGLDEYSKYGKVYGCSIYNITSSNTYISGVPALVENDRLSIKTDIIALKAFRKESHGQIRVDGFITYDIKTASVYEDTSPLIENIKDIVVDNNSYAENMDLNINILNLDGETIGNEVIECPIRIDSKSKETNRVSSPLEYGLDFGENWFIEKNKQDLNLSNELQMLNGKYQWPRGNYTNNGATQLASISFETGPDYTNIKDGIRYVTLAYDIKDSSGFYFTINDGEGFEFDNENFIIKNIESLKCYISSKDKWIDMNKPYGGVLSPFETDDNGCLVVDKSNEITRYCTFGTEVFCGTIYICLGISYNLDIKLSGFTVLGNI